MEKLLTYDLTLWITSSPSFLSFESQNHPTMNNGEQHATGQVL